jgi:hypothetical protein
MRPCAVILTGTLLRLAPIENAERREAAISLWLSGWACPPQKSASNADPCCPDVSISACHREAVFRFPGRPPAFRFRCFPQASGHPRCRPGIPDGVVDLGMNQQDLYCAKVASCLVDERRLRASKRMRSAIPAPEADHGDPLVNQTRILSGAHVMGVIDTAGKRIFVDRSIAPLQQVSKSDRTPVVNSNWTGRQSSTAPRSPAF